MYVTQPWTIRQYAGFSTAEDSNAFYRRNIAAGQKGLSVAFDLATHRGYDSDHPRVKGDVGMAGVAIDSILRHAHAVRRHRPRRHDRVDDHERRGAAGAGALHRRRRGAGRAAREAGGHHPERHPQRVHGAQHLHLSARALDAHHLRHLRLHRARMPKFNSISISGYHMQEAGATADLELAYTLADGVEYARAGVNAGLAIDAFAPRLSFFFGIGMNFFMEVAKLRAARLLWAKLIETEFAPKDPRSLALRTHCQTSGWSLHRAGPLQQRRAHGHRGAGRHPRRHAVAAHQRPRRGDRAADRLLRPHRPQHPALHPAGDRDLPRHRPVGRQPLRRAAHLRARCAGRRRTSTRSRNWAAWPRRSPPAFPRCASRRRPPAPRRASTPARRPSSASTSTGSPARPRSRS